MAIDTRAKRASVVALGLPFMGPSIVPDGTLAGADRQTIGYSYYGITASGATAVTLGATSQLEALASSGGIILERILGGTSQIGVFTSSGGITVGDGGSVSTGFLPSLNQRNLTPQQLARRRNQRYRYLKGLE